MNKLGCIIQVRLGSTRLPGKALKPLPPPRGPSLLEHVVSRARRLFPTVVATTTLSQDDPLVQECERLEVRYFRGSPGNVLQRFCQAAEFYRFETVCRLTGDNPLLDPQRLERAAAMLVESGCDYVRSRGSEPGTHAEVMTRKALERALELATEPAHNEHVTTLMLERQDLFQVRYLDLQPAAVPRRWTLDTPQDYARLSSIFAQAEEPLELQLEQAANLW